VLHTQQPREFQTLATSQPPSTMRPHTCTPAGFPSQPRTRPDCSLPRIRPLDCRPPTRAPRRTAPPAKRPQSGGRHDELGVLVSAKEEADLEELLGLYALGLGEPEEFAARLQVRSASGGAGRRAGAGAGLRRAAQRRAQFGGQGLDVGGVRSAPPSKALPPPGFRPPKSQSTPHKIPTPERTSTPPWRPPTCTACWRAAPWWTAC
jgi:hypothetical protein